MNKKIVSLSSLLIAGLTVLGGCSKASPVEEKLDDPVSYYSGDTSVSLERMKAEEEKEVETPKVVKLHYHNDDNACLNRRFYTWVTGIDGIERKPNEETWSPTDMEITLDFNEITDYQGSISLFFIIKVAGTWAGQSEDT